MTNRECALPWQHNVTIAKFPQIPLVTGWAINAAVAEAALKKLSGVDLSKEKEEDPYFTPVTPLCRELRQRAKALKIQYKLCDAEDVELDDPPLDCMVCSNRPGVGTNERDVYVIVADVRDWPNAGEDAFNYRLYSDDPRLRITFEGEELNLKDIVAKEMFNALRDAFGEENVAWRTLPDPDFMKAWKRDYGAAQEVKAGYMF